MSNPEKPLRVRVAEALGWEYVPQRADMLEGGFWIAPNRDRGMSPPRYDTDWASGGPLIEKYGISLLRGEKGWYAVTDLPWVQERPDHRMLLDGDLPLDDPAPTPLLAACYLILALHQAGKLKP